MSFANLKKGRGANISKMLSAVEEQSNPTTNKKSYVDERIWKPTVDKAGNGYAVLRFLPASEGSELPWVQYWDHGFKGPTGQWYIEKSLTSIGQKDPVSELNSRLWNSGNEADKDTARTQKRRLHYVSNVLIESDPANPQNEGKVFFFVYGKKIFDKIMDVMKPQFQDEQPIDPFDFWEGASFKLKMRNGDGGFRSYDKSEFGSPSPLSDDEDELKAIYDQLHDLNEYTDPSSYKTYDELAQRLALVLGESVVSGATLSAPEAAEPPVQRSAPVTQPISVQADLEEEDTMSYFAKLAAED